MFGIGKKKVSKSPAKPVVKAVVAQPAPKPVKVTAPQPAATIKSRTTMVWKDLLPELADVHVAEIDPALHAFVNDVYNVGSPMRAREILMDLSFRMKQVLDQLEASAASKAIVNQARFEWQYVDAMVWVRMSPPWVDCICGAPRPRYGAKCEHCGRSMGQMAEREREVDESKAAEAAEGRVTGYRQVSGYRVPVRD